jgi:hypothetical protein
MLDFALLTLFLAPATPLFTLQRPSLKLARIAVLLGAVEFFVRAILRLRSDWLSDLAAPYTSAKLMIAGADPYNPFTFLSTWYASGAPNLGLSDFVSGTHSVYPPPTLLLMSPLALLRWTPAVIVFGLAGLVLYFVAIRAMLRLGWPQYHRFSNVAKDPLALLFLAASLGFAPIHSAFHSLNIVLFAACAAILAITLSLDDSRSPISLAEVSLSKALFIWIGVTAAILLKPTTGIFLLPWLANQRRWRLIAAILTACSVITALSVLPLIAHWGTSWLTDYRQNVAFLFTHGGNADVSPENTENTDRVDLQLVFFALFGSRALASACAALVYIVLLGVFLKGAGWGNNPTNAANTKSYDLPLLVAAGCLALGLLPSYTRVYAAVVLLPLVLWCFTHFRFSSARWLLLLLSDFLLNTSALVRRLAERANLIPHSPRFWNLTIGGHTCWILLAIGVLLIKAVREQAASLAVPVNADVDSAMPVPLEGQAWPC